MQWSDYVLCRIPVNMSKHMSFSKTCNVYSNTKVLLNLETVSKVTPSFTHFQENKHSAGCSIGKLRFLHLSSIVFINNHAFI